MPDTEDLNIIRKRLIYRACHRGTREMDMILGPFAAQFLPKCDAAALARFTLVLEEADSEFMSWITGQSEIPADADREMIAEIVQFGRGGLAK